MRIPLHRGVAAVASGAVIALTMGAATAQAQEIDSSEAPACIDTELSHNQWANMIDADVTNNCGVTHSVTVLWGSSSTPDECVALAPGETTTFSELLMIDYQGTELC